MGITGKIEKEIKQAFDYYKNASYNLDFDLPTCQKTAFRAIDHWMYYYLFPEVLEVWDDIIKDMYNNYAEYSKEDHWGDKLLDFEEYYDFYTIIYPCWTCSEEQVLRIMSEHGIL